MGRYIPSIHQELYDMTKKDKKNMIDCVMQPYVPTEVNSLSAMFT